MTPNLERAVELIAGWDGPAASWHRVDGLRRGAGGDVHGDGDADAGVNSTSHLMIVGRSRVEEEAGARVAGAPVRQFHRWKGAAGLAYVPSTPPATDAAHALSLMTVPRRKRFPALDESGRPVEHALPDRHDLLPDLLLLFAREDVTRWPKVRGYLQRQYGGRPAVLAHAMAALMRPCKRTRIGSAELARMVPMRKADYLQERARAEAVILDNLERAASAFLQAYGNRRFPAVTTIDRRLQEAA